LLDAIAQGLSELPSVKLTELPRMADFATFAEAVGRALGWQAETVLASYAENRQCATATEVEDSLLAHTLVRLARVGELNWYGTAAEMLEELDEKVNNKVVRSARWPKSPGWLANELRRVTPQLRGHGIFVTFERTAGQRMINVQNSLWREKYRHA
jgi:hypothetical protein